MKNTKKLIKFNWFYFIKEIINMKKDTLSKIVAIIALISISIWVLWTWILVLLQWGSNNWNNEDKAITNEKLEKMIKDWQVKVNTETWVSK